MSEDSDREEQRFEDPGGEVYAFFRYLYELDPKDSHLAYEAWYELPFEEKAFWATVLRLEQRLGVSYKGEGVDSSVPGVPSEIIELGISAATRVSGVPLQCNVLLRSEFSAVIPAGLKRGASWRMGVTNSQSIIPRSKVGPSTQLNVAGDSTAYDSVSRSR